MAKKKFETAGEEATRAFSNPALNTEDKILATKLRIMSSILQGIQDVEAGARAAVMYLERLHDLPAIREAFAVYLDGGFKSMFGKAKRLEIVQDISVINFELFYFVRIVAKASVDLFSWPKIKLENYEYQPILPDPRIPPAYGPFHIPLTDVEVMPSCCAINSKGNVLMPVGKGTICIFFAKPASTTEPHETFWSFSKEEQEDHEFTINSMAIDADDNLYVMTFHECHLSFYALYTIDSKGALKHKCLLSFLNESSWSFFKMNTIVVNKLGQIVMGKVLDDQIYTFDHKGQLYGKFQQCGNSGESSLSTVYMTCSDTNEVIMAIYDENSVHVYTATGKYNRTFFPPDGHSLAGIAFNHITKSIILLTRLWRKSTIKMCLSCYAPDTDKPQMVQLPDSVTQNCHITSHVSGLVAVFTESGVIFI